MRSTFVNVAELLEILWIASSYLILLVVTYEARYYSCLFMLDTMCSDVYRITNKDIKTSLIECILSFI